MSTHPSTLQLHRLRYGELDPAEAHRIRAHVSECTACTERLHLQEAQRTEFVLEPVPQAIRQLSSRPSRPWWLWIAPSLVAVAAAALVVVWSPESPETEGTGIRTKGSLAALEVVAEREGGTVLLAPGSVVVPGDRLQMKFDPGDHAYAAFAGRDGTGVVQVYRVLKVDPGGLRPAPFALELDDTPGDQDLFVVFSDQSPDPVWIVDVLDNGASPEGAVVASIRLRKEIRY